MQEASLDVLLVEDNAFDAELTAARLESCRPGSRLEVVDHEAAFVGALRSRPFDLILSDFALPAFSGLEALALARRLAPEVPFIFVSGVLGEEHVVDVLKKGATDYVVKVRMERLPLVVDRAIAEAAERRARQHTERALRESETLYARLVESLHDHAIVSLSPAGEIRSWNSAAGRLFGYALGEVQGRSAALLFPPRDAQAFERLLAQARGQGHVASDDRLLQRKDGSTFWSTGALTAVREADGSAGGFALIARDVTERIRAAEAVEAARREAERANQAKDRFLAVLSHELRTPLTPLLAIAHVLEGRSESLPPEVRRLVPMLRRNVLLEARLIDDLLDLTAIERGKLALRRSRVDLHATLRSALEMCMEEARRKQLAVELALDARDAQTEADDARLQQVFWNLIRNAVKFTPEGGRIRIETRNPAPGRFEARVSDSGVGIAPDRLGHIFRLFEQGGNETHRAYGGLGIGLAIARALVRHHHGTLDATSDGEGRGATFSLGLPLVAAPVEAAGTVASAVPDAAAPAADAVPSPGALACRVLLVEDHADVATSVRAMLEAAGHTVQTAASVREARATLAVEHFDALVCDLGLPDGSGHEVLALAGRDLPAVAISGFGMQADLRASRSAGFGAHLVKPFEAGQLLDALRRVTEDAGKGPPPQAQAA